MPVAARRPARLYYLTLDLATELERCMVEATRHAPPTTTDPWSDAYAGYRLRADVLDGLLTALCQGQQIELAIERGVAAGRKTLAEYLRGMVYRRQVSGA